MLPAAAHDLPIVTAGQLDAKGKFGNSFSQVPVKEAVKFKGGVILVTGDMLHFPAAITKKK